MRNEVLQAIWIAFGVDEVELTQPGRGRYAARARFAAAIVMNEHGANTTTIASWLRRDRSTVSDGIRAGLSIECPDFTKRLEQARRITQEAIQADPAKWATVKPAKFETAPAIKLEAFADGTAEDAMMRASVNKASARLGALLALEVGA